MGELKRYSFGFYQLVLQAGGLHFRATLTKSGGVWPHELEEYTSFLAQLMAEADALGLYQTRLLAAHAIERVKTKGKQFSNLELSSDLEALISTFEIELQSESFVRIPREKGQFFERDALFGQKVAEAFPSSADDIRHAGTCFALGQNDACVFHLMRVLERGLRVIAGEIKVDFDRRNWENVLNDIEAELKRMGRGAGVDVVKRKVYAEAATQLYFVKDAWRNDVIHVRDVYDTGKAQSVLAHVGEFMGALADGGLREL